MGDPLFNGNNMILFCYYFLKWLNIRFLLFGAYLHIIFPLNANFQYSTLLMIADEDLVTAGMFFFLLEFQVCGLIMQCSMILFLQRINASLSFIFPDKIDLKQRSLRYHFKKSLKILFYVAKISPSISGLIRRMSLRALNPERFSISPRK